MKNLNLSRCGLSVCAAAMLLAGCGGLIGQAPDGQAPIAGQMDSLSMTSSSARPLVSLKGETFTASKVEIQRSCPYDRGALATQVDFQVQGKANGPEVGTFKVSGSASDEVEHFSFNETFEIISGSRHIHGTAHTTQGFEISCRHSDGKDSKFNVNAEYRRTHGSLDRGSTNVLLNKRSFLQTFQ
jgi:hypothetical protein